MLRACRRLAVAVVVLVGGSAVVLAVPDPAGAAPTVAAQAAPSHLPLGGDFDGDGRHDVLWYGPGSAGDHLWFGTAGRSFAGRHLQVAGQYEPVLGDFDGTGTTDVLWYRAGAGTDYLWLGRSNGTFAGRSITVRGTYHPIVLDVDGNGRDDILWYSDSGRDVLWLGGAGGAFRGRSMKVTGSYRPVVGDFDGNGTGDILWYGPGADPDYLWRGRPGGTFVGRALAVQGDVTPLVGDLDGNRRDDILWHRQSGGNDVVWSGRRGGGFSGSAVVRPAGSSPFIGDFDGDRADDLFWYAPGATPDEVWLGNAGPEFAKVGVAVNGTYEPQVSDFDGDGREDIFWYAPGDVDDRLWFGNGRGRFVSVLTTIDLEPAAPVPLQQATFDTQYDPFGLVAHAMGPTPPAADGKHLAYTNTLEAFERNYGRGFRVFEVDFVRLADGAILGAHDGTESAFGLPSGVRFAEATRAQTGNRFRSHGTNFTALYVEDVVQLLRDHPDMYLILDSKTSHLEVYRAFVDQSGRDPAILGRVLPHVAGQGNLDALRRIYPLRNYVLALYRTQVRNRFDDDAVVDFVRRNRTPAVMMWHGERDWSVDLRANMLQHRRYSAGLVDRLRAAGAVVYVHSLNDVARIQSFQARGIGVYSDGPFPPYGPSSSGPTAIPEIDSTEPPS